MISLPPDLNGKKKTNSIMISVSSYILVSIILAVVAGLVFAVFCALIANEINTPPDQRLEAPYVIIMSTMYIIYIVGFLICSFRSANSAIEEAKQEAVTEYVWKRIDSYDVKQPPEIFRPD